MENNDHSSQTLRAGPLSLASVTRGLDLSGIPSIAILTAHLENDEETKLKETLRRYDAPLTTDVSRAKVFVGKVGTKRRAEFELRSRKLKVEEIVISAPKQPSSSGTTDGASRKRKRSSTEVSKPATTNGGELGIEEELLGYPQTNGEVHTGKQRSQSPDAHFIPLLDALSEHSGDDTVWVIRLDWIDACVSEGRLVPLGDNMIYQARVLERPKPKHTKSIKAVFTAAARAAPVSQTQVATRPHLTQDILDRAKSDAAATAPKSTYQPQRFGNHTSRRFEGKSFASSTQSVIPSFATRTANLLQTTTSEYEGVDSDIPQPPDWVKKGLKYACQRFTPANGPNEDFIEQLIKIRTARTLIDDDVGVRAYSSIIAAIAAYPHKLSHPRELAQLPGCDEKAAVLFVEWKNSSKIQAVEEFEADAAMQVLRSFYDIWGVGAKTARHFYYTNHWKELDDIIEYGWNELDRVQQIGLKYYDEFLVPIPRPEVEHIASVVRDHAVRLRDPRITVTIVGGYRRGKSSSGDVDLIVSHPNLAATANLIEEIVTSLEDSNHITHTLTLSLTNSHRGQQTLPFRSTKSTPRPGFDTLDKALVVWQHPAADPLAKNQNQNQNPHRRVDIIVSPWRTLGCAVLGWTGGTTFQRDLRRYAKKEKQWKFDSSGVRSRATGEVVELEGRDGVSGSPEEAERRVFEGLGLGFVEPEGRVTY